MVTSVLFVCLGNICRSPTAEGVFRHIAAQDARAADLVIDSAGTGAWHLGEPPDPRARAEAQRRGIDLSAQRARQVTRADFDRFDLILAMDRSNQSNLERLRPPGNTAPVELFLTYAQGSPLTEVPDPYYEDNFPAVFDLIEDASRGLLRSIRV